MGNNRQIEAIILAAGKGERMGATKQLVDIGGQPALVRVIETLRHALVERIIVVLGYQAEQIKRSIDLSDCIVAVNKDYETGMGSSLALGVKLVSGSALGFLIAHADMPYTEESSVRKVLDTASTGARIAAPAYKGIRGFPVYLRTDCLPELLETLKGDIGARDYILAHASDVELVAVDDRGAVQDIDKPEDIMGD